MFKIKVLCSVLLFLGVSAFAQSHNIEEKAVEIERLLMAPCCWGSTVAEHSSPDAIDIKEKTRAFLREGKTQDEILAYFERQYGERILTDPKREGFNWFLWLLPVFASLVAIALLYLIVSRLAPGKKANIEAAEKSEGLVYRPENEVDTISTEEKEKYKKQIDEELYE